MMITLLLFTAFCASSFGVDWDELTPLDEYVHRDDPFYTWEELDSHKGEGFTLYVLNMTSQKWQDESVSGQSIMWHYLSIIIPDEIYIHNAAILRSQISLTTDSPPDLSDTWIQRLAAMAMRSGAVMAHVSLVPFQPVIFTNTFIPRVEDSIIAYTWKLYIESENEPDPEILIQFPMVKTAKQAMDAITEFTTSKNSNFDIQLYLPTGHSKRGWVSWLLGCTDRRIFAIAPIVFDMLDFIESLQRQIQSYGGWQFALFQYWLEDISKYLPVHPRVKEIATFVDPIAYNERLTMPKLMTLGSADEFLPADSSHLFWHHLTGYEEYNYMLLLENTGHYISDEYLDLVYFNIEAFFTATLMGHDLPRFTWEREENTFGGSITVTTDQQPSLIQAWWADTTNFTMGRRDFRQRTLNGPNPIQWQAEAVDDMGNGVYRTEFPLRQDDGWRGFYIETRFPSPGNRTLIFSSEMQVIPDVFPFPRCTTVEECDLPLV